MTTTRIPVVLVVDDDPLLRMYAVDLIEDAGFEAMEAFDAAQAIDILIARPDIHVVFTDINMPGVMDGLMLAAAIRNRWPPIEIILTSGRGAPPPERMPPRSLFFSKPYDEAKLIGAMRSFVA